MNDEIFHERIIEYIYEIMPAGFDTKDRGYLKKKKKEKENLILTKHFS